MEDLKIYVGTKILKAKPMTLGEYNKYRRGWENPADEDPETKGFLVVYNDNHKSWSPEKVFNAAYKEIHGKCKELVNDLLTTENTYIVADKNIFNAPHNYSICNSKDNNLLCGVHFQEGPTKEVGGCNGVFHEDLIAICIDRLEHFQKSEFACEQNEAALMNLKQALTWLRNRTNDRKSRGVQGTYKK